MTYGKPCPRHKMCQTLISIYFQEGLKISPESSTKALKPHILFLGKTVDNTINRMLQIYF